MGQYTNDMRNERTEHEGGGTKGEQGGKGSGQVKCSSSPASKPSASFQEASSVVGAEIVGELSVPGVSVVKGASVPASPSNPSGSAGVSQGAKIKKSKDAKDAGR